MKGKYVIIKRISGGTIGSYRKTTTKYEIIYPDPNEISKAEEMKIKHTLRGGGTTKATAFPADRFHDSVHGVIKDIFERIGK